MPESPPEHFQTLTPISTSYWLPPQPSVHSVVGQFTQNFYEPPIMAHEAKEGLNLSVSLWWCALSDGL